MRDNLNLLPEDVETILCVVMAQGIVSYTRRLCLMHEDPAQRIAGRILCDRVLRRLVQFEKCTYLFGRLSRLGSQKHGLSVPKRTAEQ